jgi:DNA-binding response OmpR family regulator
LGIGESDFATEVAAQFRRLGWVVWTAESAEDARRLAVEEKATAVVLAADPGHESGVLTCAKLVRERPRAKVVLVGPGPDAELERFSGFAGATAYVAVTDGVPLLVRAVVGPVPPSGN